MEFFIVVILIFAILMIWPNKSYRIKYERNYFVVEQRHQILRFAWVKPWINMADGMYYGIKYHTTYQDAEKEIIFLKR